MEQDYLKRFDEIFGTKIKKNIKLDMPVLKLFFENFGESLYTPSINQKKLIDKKIQLMDKLEQTFTEEQRKIFKQYNEIENQFTSELEEQLFMFGYIIGNELKLEIKNNAIN